MIAVSENLSQPNVGYLYIYMIGDDIYIYIIQVTLIHSFKSPSLLIFLKYLWQQIRGRRIKTNIKIHTYYFESFSNTDLVLSCDNCFIVIDCKTTIANKKLSLDSKR